MTTASHARHLQVRDFGSTSTAPRAQGPRRQWRLGGALMDGAFPKWSQLANVLRAMGYSDEQLRELEQTINAADCDVVTGTPIDLSRLIKPRHAIRHVRYELEEVGMQAEARERASMRVWRLPRR